MGLCQDETARFDVFQTQRKVQQLGASGVRARARGTCHFEDEGLPYPCL